MNIVTVSCMRADGIDYGPEGAGAVYSDEPTPLYRFRLWRIWDRDKPMALFDMLNPSTATHLKLDRTLTRCKAFALAWGFGGFEVENLFGWRATEPEDMRKAPDPIGERNDEILLERALAITKAGGLLIAGWGLGGTFMNRATEVRGLLRRNDIKLHYLKMTDGGHPGHPLYLKKDLKPVEWL